MEMINDFENEDFDNPNNKQYCEWCDELEERQLRIEFYWIDEDDEIASFYDVDFPAKDIAKYCPCCGRKLKEYVVKPIEDVVDFNKNQDNNIDNSDEYEWEFDIDE